MARLTGKVAVVTGGAIGQGAAHVRRFVAEEAKVVFTDILEEEGMKLQQEVGGNAKFIKQDVSKAEEWERVISETEKVFCPIHVLVNNAGIAPQYALEKTSEEMFRKVFDINQLGVFLGLKSVVPSMRKAGGGSIINISSTAGIVGQMKHLAYSASKFAIRGMTKTAALELGKDNIRINSVHPGAIKTRMLKGFTPELLAQLESAIPLQRAALPEEVTSLVLYLASDESSYSTGAEFIVDGGLTAQ